MALSDLAAGYREAAEPLRARLRELRGLLQSADDPDEIWHIKRRIAELTPMLSEMNELAELTERYYERGYFRSPKYCLQKNNPAPQFTTRAKDGDTSKRNYRTSPTTKTVSD